MADKKARAPKGGSKAPSKPRPDEKPDGVSSWGTLTLAEVPVLGPEVPRAPGAPMPLNSLGLPDPSGVENASFIEAELGGITDRLNRALGDIATLSNENGEQLEPACEIDTERRQYQARLEAINDRFRSIEGYREHLLRSLNGTGGHSDISQEVDEHDRHMPSPLSSLRERMANTQSGYVKLRDLNQQMLMMNRGGKQEEAGFVTEVDIQANVISRFKEMFQARKNKPVDRNFGDHWKHAAGEIVALLTKVRQEGEMDVEAMRKTLENTEKLISKQVEALARLEERVYDKQEELNQCKKSFSVLESDNMLLNSEVSQYRSSVIELKKKIKKLEAQLKDTTISGGTEAESDVGGARTRRIPEVHTTVGRAENEKLIDKVTTLEMKVIEKETKNMRMEIDVSEMLENIRDTSPEAIRHLRRSIDLAQYLPEVQVDEDDDPSKEVAINVGESVSPFTRAIRSTSTVAHSYSNSPTSRSRTAKRAAGPRTPAQVLRGLGLRSPGQRIDDRTESAEGSEPTLADFNREHEHCTRLASELEAVKKELARAKKEIVGLQFGSNRTYAINADRADDKSTSSTSQPSITREDGTPAERPREWQRRRSSDRPPKVAKLLSKVPPSTNANKSSDERTLFEQLKSQGLHNAEPRRNVRVIRQSMTRKTVTIARHEVLIEEEEGEGNKEKDAGGAVGGVKGEGALDDEGNVVSFEEYAIVDKGMQTDPVLDPLGAWSNMKSVGIEAKGTAPLQAPPEEWAQFDPTPIGGPLEKGVDVCCFVERELSRIITGISGFTSYVRQLLDREVSEIAKRNDNIRSQMSERSLRRVEKMACGNEQPGDHDTSLNGKPIVPPIRRGRFELVRDNNQTSNFANRVAFASYTTGRRTSVIQETETASKSATSDVADYYRLFLPIMKHLHGADAEAQRRLDDELSDGKRTMTSCQRWNIEAELIGKHATDVLKGICDFFRNTVDKQTQEHEFLTKGLKMKEELEHAFRGGLPHDISLKVKRSLSHSDFLEAGHALAGKGFHTPTIPVQSKSLSSIESSHRYLPSLMIPRPAAAPTNRDEMVAAKTVLPRKGMVRLQAIGAPKKDNKTADKKRGHRPAPQNHRKLVTKQKNTEKEAKKTTTLKQFLFELEEPEGVPPRKRLHRGKGAIPKHVNKKIIGPSDQHTISGVIQAAKRQLNAGELRGKTLTVFSN